MTHKGTINSDAAINTYQSQYDDMPRKYAIEVNRRTPLLRRLLRWLGRLWG